MTYTEPEIIASDNLSVRAYITFYFEGERMREYTGRNVGIRILPNRAKTVQERNQRLEQLRKETLKNLVNGTYPVVKEEETKTEVLLPVLKPSAKQVLDQALANKLKLNYSPRYKEDLKLIHTQFTTFLTLAELEGQLSDIPVSRFDQFLQRFASSGTYYTRRRSDLSILCNAAFRILREVSFTKDIQRVKNKEKLHLVYTKNQMKKLLNYLREENKNLFYCCLLTYGCWLRPHIEIRSLTKSQFKNNYTQIHLSGEENKGGKVRVVHVPEYVRKELVELLDSLEEDLNIFNRTLSPFNEDYFSTVWGRLRETLLEKQLILNGQTIYSFRHTAAVEVYRKTKDVYLLQRMLGHSSIQVTIRYLRGLGEVDIQEMIDAAPTL